jgi:hypothetical protein
MKKICILVAGLMAGSMAVNGQTIYDANNMMQTYLNGTARFVGMGGAMGALGGDISTTSTNPAGIAMFRSNDAMVTFGLQNTSMKAFSFGDKTSRDKTIGTIDNAGVVLTNRAGGALKFVNFALNYRRSNSFNREMLATGSFNASLGDQIATMTNAAGANVADVQDDEAYFNNNLPWFAPLAFNARLINPTYTTNADKTTTFNGFAPYYGNDYYNNGSFVNTEYLTKDKGGIDNFDVNVAFNFNERFYLGATVGLYDIDYKRFSAYTETFWANSTDSKNDGSYTLNNNYNVTGSGVDFKLGFILRPIESSPFRLGFAVHTPTYYTLTEHQIAHMNFDMYDSADSKFVQGVSTPYDASNNEMESETKYRILTPWKFDVSMGFTVDKYAAFDAEYEYADYSSAKLKDDNDDDMDYENGMMKDMLKGVHTFRLGAEFKLIPELSLRLGYNFVSGSTNEFASKVMANNTVRTDADYINTKNLYNLTAGLGFRAGSFYCDMAYVYTHRNSYFYPFNVQNFAYSKASDNISGNKINDERNRFIVTLGYRF